MRKVVLIEAECKKSSHINVNLGFINYYWSITEDLIFLGYTSHITLLKQNLSKDQISKIEFIEFVESRNSYLISNKLIFEYIDLYKGFSDLVFLSTHPNTLIPYFFKYRDYLSHTTFILHGILESLEYSVIKLIKLLFKGQYYYSIFRLFNMLIGLDKLNTVVLSSHIKKSIEAEKDFIIDRVKVVALPGLRLEGYFKSQCSIKERRGLKEIGITGFSINQNILEFLENKCVPEKIHLIFYYQKTALYLSDKFVFKNISVYKDYIIELSQLDFILLDFENEFKYSMSGRFIEAISIGKPIIAKSNYLTNWYFQEYGSLGFLYKNYEELFEILVLIDRSQVDYEMFNKNVSELRHFFLQTQY